MTCSFNHRLSVTDDFFIRQMMGFMRIPVATTYYKNEAKIVFFWHYSGKGLILFMGLSRNFQIFLFRLFDTSYTDTWWNRFQN